ncbi:MAG: cytochrome c peroxidase [Bacteroidota bacterium]|nr:cytochrome c peroxidase [Bacteroidota bacterium]
MNKVSYTLCFFIFFFSCKKDLPIIEGCTDKNALNYNSSATYDDGSCNHDTLIPYENTPYTILIPEGFPDMDIPDNNPMTVEGVELGKKLFHDPILSRDGSQSCASCHLQASSFSDPNRFSTGIDGVQGSRNASAIINLGWMNSFNWDGSASTLEEQGFEPVINPIEMNNTWHNVENTLNADATYKELFRKAFNIQKIDSTHVVMAIAQFERTLISANSRYDKYLRQELQLTPSELNGFVIFNTETGDCFHCHGPHKFMDNSFHNNALDIEPFLDIGLAKVTGVHSDNGKFKTPTLRNIEFSAPYMHDGRFATLEEVVEHYNSGGHFSSTVDPLMKKLGVGLQLTNQQKQDLITFLKALSDTEFINNPDFTP